MTKKGLVLFLIVVLGAQRNLFSIETETSPARLMAPFLDRYQATHNLAVEALFERTLVGLAYLGLGEWEKAQIQLNLCKKMAAERESRLAGEELWLALFAFQFDLVTGQKKERAWGEALCQWYCDLPTYQGLPVAGKGVGPWGVDWESLVSLEDLRFAIPVLALAEKVSENKELKKKFHAKRSELEKVLPQWAGFPESSFLVVSLLTDQQSQMKPQWQLYQIQKRLFLVVDKQYALGDAVSSEREILPVLWEKLSREKGSNRELYYEKARRAVHSLEAFQTWKQENNLKVYDRSHLSFLNQEEGWFVPDAAKRNFNEKGVADICFDFFQQRWNPLVENEPILSEGETEATRLAAKARWYLLNGEHQRAEQTAKTCVDRFGPSATTQQDQDAVAACLLVIGKLYRDKADEAGSDFKFSMADRFEQQSDEALQKAARQYPTASVGNSRGNGKKLLSVIKDLY